MKFKIFLTLLIFSLTTSSNTQFKNLDIEIIAPSSGASSSIWNKIFKITGKKCEISTKLSNDQVFANQNFKFQKLDKSLRSDHRILWALRGGYGLDKIMFRIVNSDYSKETKKIIIGYSDITSLLIYFSQKYNWIAINAPMLKDFAQADKSEKSYKSILDFLTGKIKKFKISDLSPINNIAKNSGKVSGKVTGGNLTCIVSTIGTPWQIKPSGKILFIEDTSVSGYSLDRLLTHMENSGLFKNVSAIIFGNFGMDVSKILKVFSEKINIPVYKSNSFGHGKDNLPFGYGFDGIIKKNKTNLFEIEMKP